MQMTLRLDGASRTGKNVPKLSRLEAGTETLTPAGSRRCESVQCRSACARALTLISVLTDGRPC
ncbi:hypothetical protein EDB97_102380 [Agrobacterium tumefaciens]|nr:hypothetical protein EDB97_102380 [Agrobacterium tumefaciens]